MNNSNLDFLSDRARSGDPIAKALVDRSRDVAHSVAKAYENTFTELHALYGDHSGKTPLFLQERRPCSPKDRARFEEVIGVCQLLDIEDALSARPRWVLHDQSLQARSELTAGAFLVDFYFFLTTLLGKVESCAVFPTGDFDFSVRCQSGEHTVVVRVTADRSKGRPKFSREVFVDGEATPESLWVVSLRRS